ncbi:SMC5-SMC6 complex localization factor protein 2 [Notothenia coriiceps]|uniref:SMC5-SMC6 complex localization factor protein 2 n=1 Tax=Notothenia coriiceps TaxID=8208 RepID=A0A6I9MY41_9TELE|nr:PREDICTED: protein FAM178A-like [Notothenia coriiceps]
MKPSNFLNRFSSPPPPPTRMLPFQSPELPNRWIPCPPCPPWPPFPPPRPFYSSAFVPRTPPKMGSSGSRFQVMPRGSPAPHHHHHNYPPPGFFFSPGCAPFSPPKRFTPVPRPPSVFHPASSQFMTHFSNYPPPSHIRRDQATESTINATYSGSQNVTAQSQESNKAPSSDVRSSIPTIELQKPPFTPSFGPSDVPQVSPLPIIGSEHYGSSQRPHSPLLPCENQQHKRTSSKGNVITVDWNCSSQKRHREPEECGDSAKRPCLLPTNSVEAQTPTPTPSNWASTSLLSEPSARHSSGLELSPKTTDSHPCAEPALKPAQSSCASLSPKSCTQRRPPMGAKQAYIKSDPKQSLIIELRSPSKEESATKRSEENDQNNKSSPLLSSEVPQKNTVGSSYVQLGCHHSVHTHCSSSVLPVETLSKCDAVENCNTSKPASQTISGSLSTVERNKTNRLRRPSAIPSDIDRLFTPDPLIYGKTSKPKIDGIETTTTEKSCSSSTVTSSSTPPTGTLCFQTAPSLAVDTKVSNLPSSHNPHITMPTVTLKRINLENLKSISYRACEPKNCSIASSGKQLKDESLKSDGKLTILAPHNVRPSTSETCTTTSTARPHQERCTSEGRRKSVNKEDPEDLELDLGLRFALNVDLTESSNSSDDEQLLSLQDIFERVSKPPDTPEKGSFSEPSTPGNKSCKLKTQPLAANTTSAIYNNNLDHMLDEINTKKRGKEVRTQLLTECEEDQFRIAEYEKAEENREAAISSEQQEFLQRYSLMSSAIREVPPGKMIFILEKFGRIFNQETLQLRRCMVNPQGTAQKTLLWSSPAQLRLHLNIELFQDAYDCCSPCPSQVTSFLFKMMSVHRERMVSENILKTLCDIALTAAYQIVKSGNQQFEVWVPSLADVVLVLMNMGVAFVALFPLEHLQPPFTEGDLLEDICIKSESPSSNEEHSNFPDHNCNNILKYLWHCMSLCPRVYSDDELLLLLTVVGRVGLDPRLILESNVELCPLQFHIVKNIRDWDTMLPRICLAFTDLTDDHHNMCALVKLLPDNARGKQLRQHLSLSMISKLLDGSCTYKPTAKEFQLSELRNYLPRMQPSTLLRGMLKSSSRRQGDEEEDMAALDQQTYYLCYSLLILADEASDIQFFLAHQKKQLLFLCTELETHVKCDIRENEKCLYRSKVKDLVARIYTKWQMLLQRTRPLHGKLYDYWQPLSVATVTSSQEEQEVDNSDDGEEPMMEEDEEEDTNDTEEVVMLSEDEEKEE